MNVLLYSSLALNALILIAGACLLYHQLSLTKATAKPAPEVDPVRVSPADHPSIDRAAFMEKRKRAQVINELIQRVTEDQEFRETVLGLIPVSQSNKMPFTALCRVFREKLNFSNHETSRVLIHLRVTRVIHTDGRDYWK